MFPAEKNPRLERVGFELRSTGIRPATANPLRSGTHSRGYLPHVKREGAAYFVTFRLNDSLPREVMLKLQSAHAERLRKGEPLEEIQRQHFREIEKFLDHRSGECLLSRPEVAEMVTSALRHFEGARYRLDAWVVMPNHVHAVLSPMPNHALSAILQSWKRFTAREANKLLGRVGQPFWQPESYDHWIRNDQEHVSCCRYTVNNPVKARLCAAPEEWPWSSLRHSSAA